MRLAFVGLTAGLTNLLIGCRFGRAVLFGGVFCKAATVPWGLSVCCEFFLLTLESLLPRSAACALPL
eukprot:COSAG06_NODE_3211_length_5642_cov_5.269824_5_plen_67_part_00